MRAVLAGGAVVTRPHRANGREVVVVHRPRYNDWSLPKGKIELGESVAGAAVREVWEETGVKIRLGVPLDTISYNTEKSGTKRVSYWGGTPLEVTRRAPDEEVDAVSWLPIKAALKRLSYEQDRFLLEQFLEQPATTPLLIVRHAKAMDRKDWAHPDPARPINARGRVQANRLVSLLDAYGTVEVISSSATRCVSTLTPFAQCKGLVIDQYSALSEEEGADKPDHVRRLMHTIKKRVGKFQVPTAICGHRPVLGHMFAALDLPPFSLATSESVVAHITENGSTHAVERHRAPA